MPWRIFLDKETINAQPTQAAAGFDVARLITSQKDAGQSLPKTEKLAFQSSTQTGLSSGVSLFRSDPWTAVNVSQLISRPMTNWTRVSLKEHAISRTHVESVNDAAQFQWHRCRAARCSADRQHHFRQHSKSSIHPRECALFCARHAPEHWLARSRQWRVQPWKRWAPQKRTQGTSFRCCTFDSWEQRPSVKGALRFDGKRTEESHIQDTQSSEWTAWVCWEVSPRQDSSWHQEEGNSFTLADEAADCSNQEQMVVVIRVVDPDTLDVHEEFMDFLLWEYGTTGRALADMLLGWLEDKQLHAPHCSQLSGYWWSKKLIQDDQSMSKCGLFGVLFKKNSGGTPTDPQANQ